MNYTKQFNELNPADMPMVDTHYYQWLANGGYQDDSINCKTEYLKQFGFVRGADKVDSDCVKSMTYILSQYFANEVVPALPAHQPIGSW